MYTYFSRPVQVTPAPPPRTDLAEAAKTAAPAAAAQTTVAPAPDPTAPDPTVYSVVLTPLP